MKALDRIRAVIDLRLRTQSDDALKGIKRALACVLELHDRGCTVQQVTVRPTCVTIDIDRPAATLAGALHVSRVNGPYRERVMVTHLAGCQVQWIERADLRPAAVGA